MVYPWHLWLLSSALWVTHMMELLKKTSTITGRINTITMFFCSMVWKLPCSVVSKSFEALSHGTYRFKMACKNVLCRWEKSKKESYFIQYILSGMDLWRTKHGYFMALMLRTFCITFVFKSTYLPQILSPCWWDGCCSWLFFHI